MQFAHCNSSKLSSGAETSWVRVFTVRYFLDSLSLMICQCVTHRSVYFFPPFLCSLFFEYHLSFSCFHNFLLCSHCPELFLMSCCLTDNQSCQFGDFATKLRDLLIVAATFINVLSKRFILAIFDYYYYFLIKQNK